MPHACETFACAEKLNFCARPLGSPDPSQDKVIHTLLENIWEIALFQTMGAG
jgi:hypothetical protein